MISVGICTVATVLIGRFYGFQLMHNSKYMNHMHAE